MKINDLYVGQALDAAYATVNFSKKYDNIPKAIILQPNDIFSAGFTFSPIEFDQSSVRIECIRVSGEAGRLTCALKALVVLRR